MQARPWPDAERLFRSDPRWLGGDDAYSIALGDDRRLWLFGDTFVDQDGTGDRRRAHLINNSVAVQHGTDPATATMTFHWTSDGAGAPGAVFTDPEPGVYLWPGDGAVVDGRLVLFFMRIRATEGPSAWWRLFESLANFEVVGWSAGVIDRPDLPPDAWEPTWVERPQAPFAKLVGSGGVLVSGGYLYAHAVPRGKRRPWRSTEHLLARWPRRAVHEGDLSAPEWWMGERGWAAQSRITGTPAGVAGPALTEFTVHRDGARDRFVRTELVGFVFPRVRVRSAPAIEGPWSRPRTVFRPGQTQPGRVFCYAGKAHLGLDGADVMLTYNSNARNLEIVQQREDLYRPHCLALTDPREHERAGGRDRGNLLS